MTRFLFGLFMVLPFLSSAQSNFQKGYLITNKKDTLKGWIDYRELAHNPTSVSFSDNGRTETKTYTLKDCAEFHIDYDHTTYRRFLVDITTASIEFSDLSDKVDKSFRTDSIFLQVLQEGSNVTLYSYTDRIKERLYIQDKTDEVPVELIRALSHQLKDPSKIMVNIQYVRQLMSLVRKYGKWTADMEKKLSILNYQRKELIRIVLVINDQQLIPSKFPKTRWFAGLSLDLGRTKFEGESGLALKEAKSKTTASPMISGGFDVFVNPAIRKLVFRTALSLVKTNSEVSSPKGFNAFDMVTATLNSGVLYHVYHTENFKVYLSGAFGVNFSDYSNENGYRVLDGAFNEFKVDHLLKMRTIYLSFPVHAGVVLNKRIEFLAGYNFPTSMVDYVHIGMYRQRMRVGLNCLFGKY
ncbi:hypothetical protein H9X96_08815 [Pedobacter sp. N36a]|uniref:hypothetical protein n=1 Tax=Pedobacter sp. N36a TaxID=2767996 RepID=UPI001656B37A|nr:hypothetical protein [Pedobacter sp. N36a]MBC8985878.1 hypothetical protein [Pedobacter sp. N36a]